jgi:predicted murein hydrolase (TIGR00659 family)
MIELCASPFFGIAVSIASFWLGVKLQKRTHLVICNPLLIAVVVVSALLVIFKIPYEYYNNGGSFINMFLAPVTACLAVSIYSHIETLKKNWLPIAVGCTAGSITSMLSVYALCRLFALDKTLTYSLIPKSVTTPIAISISAAHGGIVPLTLVAVVITGLLGGVFSPPLIKLFRVKDAMTAGLSIGTCSHAIGTSKALELGETEGAMSGLAIGVSGIVTVLLSQALDRFI